MKNERLGESATVQCLPPRIRIRPVKRFKTRNRPRAFPRLPRGTRYGIAFSRRRIRDPLFHRRLLLLAVHPARRIAWTPAPTAMAQWRFSGRRAARVRTNKAKQHKSDIKRMVSEGKRHFMSIGVSELGWFFGWSGTNGRLLKRYEDLRYRKRVITFRLSTRECETTWHFHHKCSSTLRSDVHFPKMHVCSFVSSTSCLFWWNLEKFIFYYLESYTALSARILGNIQPNAII